MTYDEIYQLALSQGASPLFADMLASRQPPGTRATERAFMQGRNNNEDLEKMNKTLRDALLNEAKQAGVSIAGKTYCSGIARRVNDPGAWVSGRDDVLAKVKRNGWSCEGNVNYRPAEVPEALPRIRERRAKEKLRKQ